MKMKIIKAFIYLTFLKKEKMAKSPSNLSLDSQLDTHILGRSYDHPLKLF